MNSPIEQWIPHRPPMLLVDEIVKLGEAEIHCRKTFHTDEHFVQGHYPGKPIVPGVILCEVALQSGAILLAACSLPGDDDGQNEKRAGRTGTPVVTKMNDVRFRKMVIPGDTVVVHTELIDHLANAFVMKSKMTCDGKQVMRLDFTCALAESP